MIKYVDKNGIELIIIKLLDYWLNSFIHTYSTLLRFYGLIKNSLIDPQKTIEILMFIVTFLFIINIL